MATDDRSADNSDADAPRCPPCRGTGQVISNLGGSPSRVTCPWCEGTGHWLPDHDAQAHAREQRARGNGG